VLSADGISKAFGGVRALDGVHFQVAAGEIHALTGENGAGKSTLIKVLCGAIVPDAGNLALDGAPLPCGNPPATRRRGISCVHQEFTLVPQLSITDNIFLGRERGGLLLDRRGMRRAAAARLEELGVTVHPDTLVSDLSVPQQQMIEIARALEEEARVLILDEPTAALAQPEIDRLFAVLRRLRASGLAIVYISHRLDEIFALADRVTVLRDGRHVATADMATVDRPTLIRWMVGRDLAEEYPPRMAHAGGTILEVERLSSPGRFHDVSLSVGAGEIVGLAGLAGAGRTSTALALVGALDARGIVRLRGQTVHFQSPREAIDAGLGYVTEDRKARGLFPALETGANITISFLRVFASRGWLSLSRERLAAQAAATDFNVRAASLRQTAATLSGGNQQKLLLARALLRPRAVLILDEPTRGVDVGARAEIYRIMNTLTTRGLGILMISSDLNEILGMSDRIVVLRDGRTAGELPRGGASAARIMAMATGATA